MEIPKLVIKVEVEGGPELFTATVSVDMAGRFLEYLGVQCKEPVITSRPVGAPSTGKKAGEESCRCPGRL